MCITKQCNEEANDVCSRMCNNHLESQAQLVIKQFNEGTHDV